MKTSSGPSHDQDSNPASTDSVSLRVTEIFYSIQGESRFTGNPCVFVRLTGCPLRCTWCDTEYAFHEGTDLMLQDIVTQVKNFGCQLVEITGGEPLAQPGALPLIQRLCDHGFQVLLETSGAMDVSPVDTRATIVLDVKCPGSEMSDRMYWDNLNFISKKDDVKFVIRDRQDYDWAVEVLHRFNLCDRCTVLFSPVFGELDLQQLAGWILRDRLAVRFQVQLHKFIWDPHTRGV